MERIKFVSHKGKQILAVDISDCNVDEVLQIIDESGKIITQQPPHSLLVVSTVKNAQFNRAVVSRMKTFLNENRPYILKSAVVGVSGLQRVVYLSVTKITGRNIPAFDDIEQAKDWLVE